MTGAVKLSNCELLPGGAASGVMMSHEQVTPQCGCRSRLRHLTVQEIQILLLAAKDLRDREIATKLCLSPRTVEQHFASMRRKAQVRTRGGLIGRSFAAGILRPGEWPPQWTGWRCLAVPSPALGVEPRIRSQPGRSVVPWPPS
jgi:DNA-binding CsgD family transcriptional regulator